MPQIKWIVKLIIIKNWFWVNLSRIRLQNQSPNQSDGAFSLQLTVTVKFFKTRWRIIKIGVDWTKSQGYSVPRMSRISDSYATYCGLDPGFIFHEVRMDPPSIRDRRISLLNSSLEEKISTYFNMKKQNPGGPFRTDQGLARERPWCLVPNTF